jgi:Na+-transporting NADH:ubiquinone oxidoreductase subunit C
VKDSVNTLVFAAVLGIVCSLCLAGASIFTAPYRQANEEAERVRNFLGALEVDIEEGAGAKELLEVFERDVRVEQRGDLEFYEYVPDPEGEALSTAVPFSGPGLWAPIHGVLALEADQRTILGIRFYKHEETPGLGGEISAEWFLEKFPGKKIVAEDGTASFVITKPGSDEVDNGVDGITGATMTCDLVAAMLNDLAAEIVGGGEKND